MEKELFAGKDTCFQIQENEDHTLSSIRHAGDVYQMNWVSDAGSWGAVTLPEGISVTVKRCVSKEGGLIEQYTFRNEKETDYFNQKTSLGIKVPLPDNYKSAEICMTRRCHAHIWCGGSSSYIAAVRMGGKAPHLGLRLRSGKIDGYSMIRDTGADSNDRGAIILHPEVGHLLPGEAVTIAWELFWFGDIGEFCQVLESDPAQIQIRLDKAVCFCGEESEFRVSCGTERTETAEIRKNGVPVAYKETQQKGQRILSIKETYQIPEEQHWEVSVGDYTARAALIIMPEPGELVKKRCSFIAAKQQYHNPDSHLDGAFLIYDNDTGAMYYSDLDDHNGGRERVGMGVLLAKYLQGKQDQRIEKALDNFTQYVYRELFDEKTGTVYNDIRRNNTWNRLYNYPWMAVFFMERWHLYQEERDLLNMYKIISAYYEAGGDSFYAIAIPMYESVQVLEKASRHTEADKLRGYYEKHGAKIMQAGLAYPAHEVNYEQSIVAPAVIYLMQLYQLTEKEEYLTAGKEQLRVLELFNGSQPDYHLFANAIRHWDGFWFGKRRNYGDTFPHYWSALTGLAYKYYAEVGGDESFIEKAENSLRGVLSLFSPNGSASCAYVYPEQVNGEACAYADPWANDQDWGLYFYLKEGEMYHG